MACRICRAFGRETRDAEVLAVGVAVQPGVAVDYARMGPVSARVTIRAAVSGDLNEVLRLAETRRRLYARYQPVFWRSAVAAADRQRPYLLALIEDDRVITVVADTGERLAGFAVGTLVAAPPVYDPGGPACLVDDFAVDDPERWSTVGVALLRALRGIARDRGATQVVVTCGHLDAPKQAALNDSGLQIASEWWVAPLSP